MACNHRKSTSALKYAIIIAFIFMALEIVFGLIANSLALLSDALHMFADVGALGLSFVVLKIAQRPRTETKTFGFNRAEILGALGSSLSLWALSGILIYEAVLRLINPQPVHGAIVFYIATIGLVANIVMMRILHHGKSDNINIKAAYLHVLGDLLASIGVILSGIILWLTDWYIVDPLITLLFSLVILYHSGKIILQTIAVLMESAPPGFDSKKIKQDLTSIPCIKEVHDLHIWSVSMNHNALSAHIVSDASELALRESHRLLEEKYDLHHMTLQVESTSAFESRFCLDCDNPQHADQ